MGGLLCARGTRHVELDKLPKLNEVVERSSPKRLLVEFDVFEFPWKMLSATVVRNRLRGRLSAVVRKRPRGRLTQIQIKIRYGRLPFPYRCRYTPLLPRSFGSDRAGCFTPRSFGSDRAGCSSPRLFGSDRAGGSRRFRFRFGRAVHPFRTGAGTPLFRRGRSGATAREALRRSRSEATAREARTNSDSGSVRPSTLSVKGPVHPSPAAVVRKRPRGRLSDVVVRKRPPGRLTQIQIQILLGRSSFLYRGRYTVRPQNRPLLENNPLPRGSFGSRRA